MKSSIKQSSEGLGKAIRVSRQRRAAYFLAGLMSTRLWGEKFDGDFPEGGDIEKLSRMGLSLPKRDCFPWGASQTSVAFYDPEKPGHAWVLDAALDCADGIAEILRAHGVDQREPLTPEELAGLGRLSWLESGEPAMTEISPAGCLPKSVLDAALPEKSLKALKEEVLDYFESNLGDLAISESKLEDIFPLEEADGLHVDEDSVFAWTHAATVGSKFFSDITHDDEAASAVVERDYEIAEAARLAARKISLWLRAAIALEPGFCLPAEETGALLLGARVNPSHPTEGVPACVLNDRFIPKEFVKRLREKAIELFEPVDAEIARAIEHHRASDRKKQKAGMSM